MIRSVSLLLVLYFLMPGHTLLAEKYKRNPHDHVYNKVKSRKELVIAVSDHYPPLHFNGKGVQIQMATSLASFLGVKFKLVPYPSNKTIQAVETNKVDISIAGIFRSLARAKRVWFSRPYLWARATALVDKRLIPQKKFGDIFEETPIQTLSDLKKIAGISAVVVTGSVYENDFHGITNKKVATSALAIESILRGDVNTFIYDSIYLKYQLQIKSKMFSKYILIEEQNYKEEFCIVLPFGDVVLKNQVDIWILLMQQRNVFQDWLNSYLQSSEN